MAEVSTHHCLLTLTINPFWVLNQVFRVTSSFSGSASSIGNSRTSRAISLCIAHNEIYGTRLALSDFRDVLSAVALTFLPKQDLLPAPKCII